MNVILSNNQYITHNAPANIVSRSRLLHLLTDVRYLRLYKKHQRSYIFSLYLIIYLLAFYDYHLMFT